MIWCALAFAVDLETTRTRATDHAIEVARSEAARRSASGAVWTSTAGSLPDIDLFASMSTGAGLTQFGFERPVASQLGVGVNGSWRLLDPSGWAGALAAHHSHQGQRAMVDWARVSARRDASLAFAALWQATAEEEVWRTAAVDAQRAADGLTSLVDSGLRPAADGARARAQAAQLDALAREAEGEVTGRCAELQALLREPIDGVCTLVEPGEVEPKSAQGVHPALVAAEQALRAAKNDRTSAVLSLAPTVDATGTVGQYVAGGQSGVGWSAGLQATLPVVSGGGSIGANQSARADVDAADLALEAQTLELTAAALRAEARWRAVLASNEALEVAVAAADQAMVLVEARYQQGLEGLEAWQSARRTRDEARLARARGQVARLQALAELESVRGVW